MTTPTTDARPPSPRAGATSRANGGGVASIPVRRAWNLPWVLIGVVMMLGSGLAFAAWAGNTGQLTSALALAHDISAGHEITGSDLTTVEVGDSAPPLSIAADDRAQVIGRAALTDLSAGTLVTADLLAGSTVLPPGRALVAVRVDDVAGPLPALRSGDTVMVVRTTDPASGDEALPPAVWPGTIFSVSRVVDQGGVEVAVVSLEVDALNAPNIASASAADRIRLVLVGGPDDIPPELLFADVLPSPEAETAPEAPPS